ncbi:MAG: ABC transporter permease [Bacillota bacterium]
MQELRRSALASYGVAERSFRLVKRYLGWEVVWLVYSAVSTLTIGLIGVSASRAGGGEAPAAQNLTLYLVIGALLWNYLSVLFQEVSNAVAWERWEGTIEYTFMAPIHRLVYLAGNSLFGLGYALLRTILIFGVAVLWFDMDLSRANWGAALLVLVSSSLSFMGLGLVAAVLPLLSPEKGPQATHIIQGLLLLVAGVYYPVDVLPEWLQPIAAINPATHTLDGVRAALMDGAGFAAVMPWVGRLLLTGVVLVPLGLWVFQVGEQYAMRTGRLKRNG